MFLQRKISRNRECINFWNGEGETDLHKWTRQEIYKDATIWQLHSMYRWCKIKSKKKRRKMSKQNWKFKSGIKYIYMIKKTNVCVQDSFFRSEVASSSHFKICVNWGDRLLCFNFYLFYCDIEHLTRQNYTKLEKREEIFFIRI